MAKTSIVSIVVGVALLVGAPITWWVMQPASTVGDLEAAEAAREVPEPAPEPEPEPEPEPDDPQDRVERIEREPEPEPEPEAVEEPASISVPAIDVDAAPVVPVGLEDDGSMEIPEDVSTIGWYDLGVMPGEEGTAVLSGHVDSRTQGPGAFFDLRHLDVDDTVTIDHDDGTSSEWRVTARTAYPKDELPIRDIFTRFSDTRLVLITCGGDFDSDTRHYTENIVVYTEPVETSA